MNITQNLVRFTIATIILTVLFRFALSSSITEQTWIGIICSSIIYALSMFFAGSYFGKKDYEILPIYDIGFRFHLFTFLAHNLVSIAWFALDFESAYEHINTVYVSAAIWSIFLIIHFIYFLNARKSTIKGLSDKDIFE